MQAASISYGKETTAAASDDDDDEGGGEGVDGQDDEELKKMMVIPGQVHAVSMEVQQDVNDAAGAPTASGEYSRLPETLTRSI